MGPETYTNRGDSTADPGDKLAANSSLGFARALVVANPIAGRGKGAAAAAELVSGLRAHGVLAELFETGARTDAWRAVRTMDPEVDLVVSVGGDGTLSEVLGGLVDRNIPVAQYPLGTANVLAKELGLPRDVDSLLEVIAGGSTTPLDGVDVNGRLSFLCTGIGFDGMVVNEVEAHRTGKITKLNYVSAAWRALRRYRPPSLRLEVDGRAVRGTYGFVLISNVREYGGAFHLSSAGRRDDGILEVYALRQASRGALAKLALTAALRELPGRRTDFFQGQHIRVSGGGETPYQVDGDRGGTGDVEVRFEGTRFRILVP